MRRWWGWAALAVVLVGAFVVGWRGDGGPRTDDERVRALTESFQCPTCRGQSVADSDAPVAAAIRSEVARQVNEGASDDDIRDEVTGGPFGRRILLNPPRSGVAGLVWVLPVVALVAAVAGLAFAFRRWSSLSADGQPSAEDRALVEQARRA